MAQHDGAPVEDDVAVARRAAVAAHDVLAAQARLRRYLEPTPCLLYTSPSPRD